MQNHVKLPENIAQGITQFIKTSGMPVRSVMLRELPMVFRGRNDDDSSSRFAENGTAIPSGLLELLQIKHVLKGQIQIWLWIWRGSLIVYVLDHKGTPCHTLVRIVQEDAEFSVAHTDMLGMAVFEAVKPGIVVLMVPESNGQYLQFKVSIPLPRKNRRLIQYLRRGARMFYMPIVSIHRGEIFGYEALARDLTVDTFPVDIFTEAGCNGMDTLSELEMACVRTAIEESARYPWIIGRKLFVNVSASSIGSPRFIEYFMRSDLPLPPWQIVFEILEHLSLEEAKQLRQKTSALFRIGYDIALDDHGVAGSSGEHLIWLRARYVKIDCKYANDILVSGRYAAMEGCLNDAEQVNGRGIIEGVEGDWGARDLANFVKHGAPLVQGYAFGCPLPADQISGKVSELGLALIKSLCGKGLPTAA